MEFRIDTIMHPNNQKYEAENRIQPGINYINCTIWPCKLTITRANKPHEEFPMLQIAEAEKH